MSLLEHDLINDGIPADASGRLPLRERHPKTTPLPPWEASPWQLVSLAEMLECYAKLIFDIQFMLSRLENLMTQVSPLQQEQDRLPNEAKDQFRQVIEQSSAMALETLESLSGFLELMDIRSGPAQVMRIRDALSRSSISVDEIAQGVRELRQRIEDELKSCNFLHVPASKVSFYTGDNLFGKAVSRKLSGLAEDIAEAGKCFALGRFTASVFHLMRVMEAGVARLAAVLSTTISLNRPWGAILRDVDTAIRALPGASAHASVTDKDRHDQLAEIASYLRHVKNAWRDRTMHPKRTYTEEEAKHLIDNVKTFMQSLVKIK